MDGVDDMTSLFLHRRKEKRLWIFYSVARRRHVSAVQNLHFNHTEIFQGGIIP